MNVPNQLGEAPVKSLFFKFYFPALASILSSTLHQIINGIILGQQVGKEGLAVVGLYGPVVIVFISLTLPVMIGGGILIGKSIGAKNYENAQRFFQFATTLALSSGVVIALSTPFLVKPIANFLAGADNTIMFKNTSDYMFWQLIALPFFFLLMFWGNFLSNDNAPKISRNASLLAVTLNIVLDLILITGLHLGVKGVSLATAISIFSATLYLFLYIQRGKSHFSFRHFQFTLKLREWRELINLGLPSFASEISFSSGLLMISHSLVSYGSLAVSAFGLVNYLSFLFIRLFTAAMIAMLPVISFNIGAKLPNRVLGIFKFSLLFTFVLGAVITTLGFIIPDMLIDLISDDETPEFKKLVTSAIALYFILFLAAGPNYILSAYFQSIGKSKISILINVFKGILLIAIFLALLPGYFNMGLNGIWLSRSLAEVCTFILIGIYSFCKSQDYYHESVITPAN